MIQIQQLGNAQAVKDYFSKELNISSYYGDELQGRSGVWHGKLADELGLSGNVVSADFKALCDGINPRTGGKLTQRWASNRRVGYDLTFTAPKGVSIVFGVAEDQRIADAFSRSTKRTLDLIENQIETRVRAGKAHNSFDQRKTGNMLASSYLHYTARPEHGIPDPHLHNHVVVFNVTKDEKEGKLKAIDLKEVKANAPHYSKLFHENLSHELEALGYEIDRSGIYPDIKISRELKALFSKRHEKIKSLETELGIKDQRKAQSLSVYTRSQKVDGITMGELREHWKSSLTPQLNTEIDQLQAIAKTHVASPAPVFDISDTVEKAPHQSDALNRIVQESKDSVPPVARELEGAKPAELNILQSRDRITGIASYPNVSSHQMLENVRNRIATHYGQDRFLHLEGGKIKSPPPNRGAVWVDNAQHTTAKELEALAQEIAASRSRVYLNADASRKSDYRASAFYHLKRSGTLRTTAVVGQSPQDQSSLYAPALRSFELGQVERGILHLGSTGAIHNTSSNYAELIQRHEKAREEGKSVLVVTATQKERKALTDALRASLLASGELEKQAKTFTTFRNLGLSDAKKRYYGFVKRGDVIHFHRSTSGFVSGDRAVVVGSGKGWMIAWDRKRLMLRFINASSKKIRSSYSVGVEEKTELRVGDTIRATSSMRAVDPLPRLKRLLGEKGSPYKINAGCRYKVKAIVGNQVMLENGFIFDGRQGMYTHGYVTSSVQSQKIKTDKVLIYHKAESFSAIKSKYHELATRGTKQVEIFTNDREKLILKAKSHTHYEYDNDALSLSENRAVERTHNDDRYI